MRERKNGGLHLTPHLNRQLAAYGVGTKPHMISKVLVDPDAGNLKAGKPREWREKRGIVSVEIYCKWMDV
jgi:hypothetical protein